MRFKVLLIALLTLCIAGSGSARHGDRETVKTPSNPEAVLVLDGSPVHDAGQLRLHTSNWGMFGSWPGTGFPFSSAPSAEWPAGSGIEYLFGGGLWVGAVKDGVPAVSTAMYAFEFRPTEDPIDKVYRTSEGAAGGRRFPPPVADDDGDGAVNEDPLDGRDNDSDGAVDEDFAAISNQMFSRWYTDDQPGITDVLPDHNPLHLMVRENSYQWSHGDYDDFVGIDYEITNNGSSVLEDVHVGVFFDPDVGMRTRPNYWEDDGVGYAAIGGSGPGTYDFAYGYDADGDGGTATGNFGVLLLSHSEATTVAFFAGDQPFEEGGDPSNDFERYELMSSGTIDAPTAGPADHRVMMSVGPFESLAPGETVTFSVALVATPGDGTFTNAIHAARVYEGTQIGRQQLHWWFPGRQSPARTRASVSSMSGAQPQATSATPGVLRTGNFPNPFNPTTRISFELPAAADVTIDIYAADGTRVRRLASADYPAGAHDVVWQGRDDAGRSVASGIYFYRLRAGDDVLTRKMVLLK